MDVKSRYFSSKDIKSIQDTLNTQNELTNIGLNDKVDIICSFKCKWKRNYSKINFKVIISALQVDTNEEIYYFNLGNTFIESNQIASDSLSLNLTEFGKNFFLNKIFYKNLLIFFRISI